MESDFHCVTALLQLLRWALSADLHDIPIETSSRASFRGAQSSVDLNIRTVILGLGIDERFQEMI